MSWLFVVGIVVFFFGLLASIALHELGHLSFAKLFGVRVPQYMVGFGPTMWSRHKVETEYGVKWIPLGGYIRMIGMLPLRREDAPGTVRSTSTGQIQGLIESASGASLEEVAKCAIPAAQAGRECNANDPVTPAVRAGLQPGDRILSYGGHKIKSYT